MIRVSLYKRMVRRGFAVTAVLLSVTVLIAESMIGLAVPDGEVRLPLMAALGIVWLVLLAAAWLVTRAQAGRLIAPLAGLDAEHPQTEGIYEELRPLIRRIAEQNARITRQMADLRAEHDKQDTVRREFTANVSHELKTPLTSISGYAEILRDGLVAEQDVPRFAGRIYDESRRMITLVTDILKLSRLEETSDPLPTEDIDLTELCRKVIRQLELPAGKKRVTVALTGEPVVVQGTPEFVEEMIYNLCDNAIKYNKDGGRVDMTIRPCVDGVELTVTDTGIGIPSEDVEHIFERFYRVDKSHSREIGGTGLGLSIVKHVALAMHAALSVESEPDVGTTVRVLF